MYILSNPNYYSTSKLQKYLHENNFNFERLFQPELKKNDGHEYIRFHVDLQEEDLLVLKIMFPELKVSKKDWRLYISGR